MSYGVVISTIRQLAHIGVYYEYTTLFTVINSYLYNIWLHIFDCFGVNSDFSVVQVCHSLIYTVFPLYCLMGHFRYGMM